MGPDIIEITGKSLIGMRRSMSLSADETTTLWQQFMKRRNEIRNRRDTGFYSVRIYDGILSYQDFTPDTRFEKWAAVEVSAVGPVPAGMERHALSAGMYAVFVHKGLSSLFHRTLQYIFETWLPDSGYELDDREHFEIMGEKYLGPHDPHSEEEVWVPIK